MALHEECGIFGIYDFDGENITNYIAYGLVALQHRGQESCGIAVTRNLEAKFFKDKGTVTDVLNESVLNTLDGSMGIGHVRYSSGGATSREHAQPSVLRYRKGSLAVAHNGALSNSDALRERLQNTGAVFQTETDSELIAYLIAKERVFTSSAENAVVKAMSHLKGAYSLLVMSPHKLIAARDPFGFRPLCIGMSGNKYVFASESCALDAVGAKFVRDVLPGEVVIIDEEGLRTAYQYPSTPKHCIFEYVYFARPDSIIDGVSVLKSREAAGRALAKAHPVDADVVIGVPDSGIDAAVGYSKESGIPYARGFLKNSYVGRSFIKPKQSERELAVKLKINPLRDNIQGKRVVVIDDSIVRGTTSAKMIRMLREAGATEIHMRVASPPFLWPCYFGTDVPDRKYLSAVTHTIDGICQMIGADSLGYLPIEDLHHLIDSDNFCDGCFTGKYPYDVTDTSSGDDFVLDI